MVMLKLQIPQETFEQLLTVASRDWRPTVWQAEWLLRKAVKDEYATVAKPVVSGGGGRGKQES